MKRALFSIALLLSIVCGKPRDLHAQCLARHDLATVIEPLSVQTLQSTAYDDASPHLLAMPGGFIMVSIRTDTIHHRGEIVVQRYDCPLTRWRRAVRRP